MASNDLDRIALLEHDIAELKDLLEQHARDHELASANINRALKSLGKNTGKSSSKPAAADSKTKTWTWDPSKITWEKKTGDNGEYEKSNDPKSQDWCNLKTDMAEHKKLNRDGFFYWEFFDGSIGRKLTKK